jgi:outer membrane protein OmpA-like peptidoglycan-associated protein
MAPGSPRFGVAPLLHKRARAAPAAAPQPDPGMTPRAPYAVPALLAAALCLAPAPCAALSLPDPSRKWYAMPSGAVVAPDGDRQTDDGWRVGLTVGAPVPSRWSDRWNLEVEGFYEELGEPAGAQHQFGVGGHALRFFHRWPPFAPFALGGTGVMAVNDFFNEGLKVFGELGGGFTQRLPGTSFTFRVDVRYRQVRHMTDFAKRAYADAVIGIGLVLPLAGHPDPAAPSPTPRLAAGPTDRDGDGVPDGRDLCPGTGPDVPVNAHGCPADGDLDGVVDRHDRCPDTPIGVAVGRFGCEPDSDGDRVANRLDACPGTRPGARVDDKGCPPVEVLRLEGVHFEFDKAVLTPAAKRVLDGVAGRLKQRDGVKVEVAGHTDRRGTEAHNQALSERRARSVAAYLVAAGVPAEMLSSRGYGERRPVADGAVPGGDVLNRRVELRISAAP